MVVQSSFGAGYSTGALTFICKHENKAKMKDWFSCSSYSGIRRPSREAEVWEASLLSSPPLPCWQQRPVELCRSSAPLQQEVTKSSTVFFSSPSSWKNMERTSKPEEPFWPLSRALQGFDCSAWFAALCAWVVEVLAGASSKQGHSLLCPSLHDLTTLKAFRWMLWGRIRSPRP